jgi:terminase large subunit-like protein
MKGPIVNRRALFADVGYEPHPGQWAIHHSKAPRRVVACGVRWGKTRCAAMEAVAAALAPRERSFGWVVAPTYDLADKVFREILLVFTRHLRHRIVTLRENDRILVVRNMAAGLCEIRGKSADSPVSLLGEGLDFLIVDEAAHLKPSIWQGYLSQRLIDRKGWALLISTPHGKGWFYDLFRKGQDGDPDYASWNHPSWSNPYLDAAVIEQERGRLPDAVFRTEYGAEFLEGSGAVFRNVRECATGNWQEPENGPPYVAGLDLARTNDSTVLVIMNSKREVVFVDRFNRLDWTLQIQRVATGVNRYRDAQIYVDSTGVGEPVFESIRAAGCNALQYPFTQRSKAALIDNLALMLEQKKIVLPKPELWPAGIDELESFEYSITDNGSVRTSAPSGAHDDCVIALALAAWHLRLRYEPPLSIGAPIIVRAYDREDWR